MSPVKRSVSQQKKPHGTPKFLAKPVSIVKNKARPVPPYAAPKENHVYDLIPRLKGRPRREVKRHGQVRIIELGWLVGDGIQGYEVWNNKRCLYYGPEEDNGWAWIAAKNQFRKWVG